MRVWSISAAVIAFSLGGGAATAAGADWRPTFDLRVAPADDVDVAVGPNGDAAVVWGESENSGEGRIFATWSIGGGAFAEPVKISPPGDEGNNPQVAIDDEGNVTAVWQNGLPLNTAVVQAAYKPAGGSFGPPDDLSSPDASLLDLAVDHQGGAVAVWRSGAGGIYAAYRAPGGSFSDEDLVSSGGVGAPRVAMGPAGDAVAIWTENDGDDDRVTTAFRAPGEEFGPAQYRSADGSEAHGGDVAMNAGGDAIAAWARNTGAQYEIEVAGRPAGGAFGGTQLVSDPPNDAGPAEVALDDSRNTTVTWLQADASAVQRAWHATAGPSSPFSDPQAASPDGVEASRSVVAAGPPGQAVLAFETDGSPDRAWASIRRSLDAGFTESRMLSPDDVTVGGPRAAMDNAGNALVAWIGEPDDAPPLRVQAGIFDATPPVVTDVAVPATGTVGVPVNVSAATSDQWSPHTTGWSFGDGATADGAMAGHVYAAPGTYDVTVTATDQVGQATTETRQITIAAAPLAPIGGPPPVAVIASVSDLRIAPRAFPAAGRGGSVAQRRRQRAGGRVSYRLNVAADVRFTVRRRARGRRVGGRCVRPTRRNRARRRCARFVRVRGSFTRASTAGVNRFRFTGRLRRRALRRGRYRLVATPRAGATAGPARRTGFRITRRR
jgi:hypothetical protein